MALDPSIILQGKAPQFDDPLTVRAKQATLADLTGRQQMQQMQMQEAQRGIQEQQTLADLYRETGGDPMKLRASMAQRGLGARIPAFDKAQAEAKKLGTESQAAEFKLAKDRLDAVNASISSLASRPDLSPDLVISQLNRLVAAEVIPEEAGAKISRGLSPDPARLRQQLFSAGLELADAGKRLEMQVPKTEIRNMGGQDQQFAIDPMTGQITPGQSFAKTATPESIMADKRAREEGALNRGVQIRGQDLNYKSAAEAREAAKVKSGGTSTEDERKAAGYAVRMEDALRTLDAVGKEDPSATKPGAGTAVTNMLPEGVANYIRPENRQRVEAAQLDALDAALTLATGAAYTKEQLKGLARAYFAQPGDTEKTIGEKTQRLKTVVETARVRSGRSEETINPILSRTGPNAPKSGPKPGAAEDGYVFMGGNPADPKNWKKQ